MNKESTYEQELERTGELIYTTVGRSMRPFLRSGKDLFRIERMTCDRYQKYNAVLYRRDNGRYVLHRIVRVDGNCYTLCGDNFYHLEHGIRHDQILGVLTHVIRDGKSVDVRSEKYQWMIRVWYFLYLPRAVLIFGREKLWALLYRVRKSTR